MLFSRDFVFASFHKVARSHILGAVSHSDAVALNDKWGRFMSNCNFYWKYRKDVMVSFVQQFSGDWVCVDDERVQEYQKDNRNVVMMMMMMIEFVLMNVCRSIRRTTGTWWSVRRRWNSASTSTSVKTAPFRSKAKSTPSQSVGRCSDDDRWLGCVQVFSGTFLEETGNYSWMVFLMSAVTL